MPGDADRLVGALGEVHECLGHLEERLPFESHVQQHVRVDEEGQTPPIRQRLLLVGVTRLRLLAVDLSRLA